MNDCPFVSIIMPVRNEAKWIDACLQGILAQDYPADRLEILIADGMSTDGTRDLLARRAEQDARIRLIDDPEQRAATGLNAAIRAARGEIIVRMDAHTNYALDYVRECVRVLNATKADNVGGPARTQADTYFERAIAAAYHSWFSVGGARFHDVDFEGYVDTVTYGCWPRQTLERIGLFDPELVRNQDDEHNLRLRRMGGKIWQSPGIRSWYRPRGSLLALFRQYMQYGYWKVRVIQKHRLPASFRHVVPGLFLLAIVVLACLTPFSKLAAWSLACLGGLYFLSLAVASLVTSLRAGIGLLPVLPAVFACYHFGYGYGFLRGTWDFLIWRKDPSARFTSLTRPQSRANCEQEELVGWQ
jgi:glycosyltransferase involved in cell wall biosynthesis